MNRIVHTTSTEIATQQRTRIPAMHRIASAPRPTPTVTYLPAIVDDTPCDGSHGRFCPECAQINRWKDRETA